MKPNLASSLPLLNALLMLVLPMPGALRSAEPATSADETTLIQRLQSGDDEQRRTAAADLAKLTPTPAILTALADALSYTGQSFGGFVPGFGGRQDDLRTPKLTGPCCEALLAYGAAAQDDVIKGINSPEIWVRYGCAWVLGNTKPGGTKDDKILLALRGLMADPNENGNVMQMAAQGLGQWKDSKAAALAQTALQTRKMSGGDVAVLAGLVARTDPARGKEVVLNFSRASQPEGVRSAALVAAGWLKDEETLKVLMDALTHGSAKTKQESGPWLLGTACGSLLKREAKEAIPQLKQLLERRDMLDNDRIEIAKTLVLLGDAAGRKTIEEFSSHPSLKVKAAYLLKALDSNAPLEPETQPGKFSPCFVHAGGGSMVMVR
jgi:HEAT repeat protein